MKKILVTGASGFIGKNLIQFLYKKNYSLKILFRNENFKKKIEPYGETFKGDLEDFVSLKGLLKDVEVIIHGAGSIKGNNYKDFYKGNVKTTENLINLIKEEGEDIKKFIYLSSLSAFGPANSEKLPAEEDMPCPISHYGKSKLEAEKIIEENLGIPVVILRLSGVYGPEDREIFTFFKYAQKGTLYFPLRKNQKIQLIYVKDVCIAVEKALEGKTGGVFFIAHSEILNTLEICFFFKEIIGKPVNILTIPEPVVKFFSYLNLCLGIISGKKTMFNPQKVKELLQEKWLCSTEKAKKELEFEAQVPFSQGARETYKWYKENNWL